MAEISSLCIVVWLTIISIATAPLTYGIAQDPKEVAEWFQRVSHAKQKLTKLHFYVHMEHFGKSPKPNTVTVAQASVTATSPTSFGVLNMMDAPFTVRPESFSEHLGYAQGFYGNDNLEGGGNIVATNFVFTRGKHYGSSITILGQNPLTLRYREMPIVGGSGKFRLAHGAVTIQTFYRNSVAGNTTLEVDIAALHY